jgi:hypothetical protein
MRDTRHETQGMTGEVWRKERRNWDGISHLLRVVLSSPSDPSILVATAFCVMYCRVLLSYWDSQGPETCYTSSNIARASTEVSIAAKGRTVNL